MYLEAHCHFGKSSTLFCQIDNQLQPFRITLRALARRPSVEVDRRINGEDNKNHEYRGGITCDPETHSGRDCQDALYRVR